MLMSFPRRTIDLASTIYRPVSGTFHLTPEGEYFTGAFSALPRSTGPRHMRWMCDLEMAPLHDNGLEDTRMTWEATIARLQGSFVAMRLFDPTRGLPRGKGAGIYRVAHRLFAGDQFEIDGQYLIDGEYHITDGSSIAYVAQDEARYADSIVMTGLVPNETVFRAGDHFSLGGNLYMVSDDALSDENGESRVRFLWKLWKPALEGDRIDLCNPTGRFVMTDQNGGMLNKQPIVGSASLAAIEVPYVE
jgi:hypothetical protein